MSSASGSNRRCFIGGLLGVALELGRGLGIDQEQQAHATEELSEQVAQLERLAGADANHLAERLVISARVHCELQ